MINSLYMLAFLIGCLVGTALLLVVLVIASLIQRTRTKRTYGQ